MILMYEMACEISMSGGEINVVIVQITLEQDVISVKNDATVVFGKLHQK